MESKSWTFRTHWTLLLLRKAKYMRQISCDVSQSVLSCIPLEATCSVKNTKPHYGKAGIYLFPKSFIGLQLLQLFKWFRHQEKSWLTALLWEQLSVLLVNVWVAGYDFSRRCMVYNAGKIAQDVCGCYRWHRTMSAGPENMELAIPYLTTTT